MLKRLASVLAVFAVSTSFVAGAAQVVEGPDMEPGSPPRELSVGEVVRAPARIETASGDVLELVEGSLEMLEPEGDVELFFLREGSLRGTIGEKTSVSTPAGWLLQPRSGKIEFYARTLLAPPGGYFEVVAGEGMVVYEATGESGGFPRYFFHLLAGQGIEIWSPSRGDVGFATPQDNPGDVHLMGAVTSSTNIHLYVPKGTTGAMEQIEGGITRVGSEAGSWKGGRINGKIFVDDDQKDSMVLGPSAVARINNETGMQVGFEQVAFEIIERAISLTSEFTAVAASNFFALAD